MKFLSNEDAMSIAPYYYNLVKTGFGVAAIVWFEDKNGPRITRVLLPAPKEKILREIGTAFPKATRRSCDIVAKFASDLQAFSQGKALTFDTSSLDMSRVPPFHRKVLRALARISKGKVSTYGKIAAKAGAPGGARAAGQGCANNPFPIVFPCHRVVRSNGSLGGFGGGLKLKRALLEMEGVRFDKSGKVQRDCIV
jgi:methylated-DNA-[protein]-cysteine S-methyltransferase